MILLKLTYLSLRSRMQSAVLCMVSIGLSFALLLNLERTHQAAEDGFTQSISQVDLVVGARSGSLQLILYSIFNLGQATHNVSYASFEKYLRHPAVEWAIPYTLGDSYRGYRVVGTSAGFFEHYRFRSTEKPEFAQGEVFHNAHEVILGSEVGQKFAHNLKDQIVLSHGATKGDSFSDHKDQPFHIVGILKPTGTPIDRSVYISLESFELLHEPYWDPKKRPIKTLTAFFLRAKNRLDTLGLQREINEGKTEPLMAVMPGVALQELWQNLGFAEKVLRLISIWVLCVSFATLILSLVSVLNERRREMVILRSQGAQVSDIFKLILIESIFLTTAGIALGTLLSWILTLLLSPWLRNEYGLILSHQILNTSEIKLVILVFAFGIIAGIYPAIKSAKTALKDGLILR